MTEPPTGDRSDSRPHVRPQRHGLDPADLAAIAALLRAAGCVRAEEEAAILVAAAGSRGGLDGLLARRVAGEPLEHVVGWAEFAGVRVRVARGVFVPRHRSGHLVDVAATLLRARRAAGIPPGACDSFTVLDLCAGTGALGLALHLRAGPFRLVAVDLDPVAVACAADNVEPVGGIALIGDLFDAVPSELRGRIDLVLANAPYVPSAEVPLLPREARHHELALALDGGQDGLDVHRRLLAETTDWLAPGGSVLIEVADVQAPVAVSLVAATGLVVQTSAAPDDPGTVVVTGRHR